ncbi:hypothetical protein KY318_03105, partial [Candidatus Woesearchaeota archaeon]|nr:hypothetical protein [Candidatus Woesearchaeota archaeon]
MREDVFKISKDEARARALVCLARDRFEFVKSMSHKRAYKIVEECYEIIKELLTALMYLDGFKTLSHLALLEYFSNNYNVLDKKQLKLIDKLRKFRNSIVYYGEQVKQEFLVNYMEEIEGIIKA